MNALYQWWRSLGPRGQRRASALALISFGYLVHYFVYCLPQPFFIEDAAISFAYSRNLVEGDGLVAYLGGERVEGYSNALWVFLIAAFYAVGVPVWTSAKVLGAVFGLAILPMSYDIARRCRPGRNEDVALLAPILLALSPQFVIWNAAGLENSLFGVLLAGGVWRLLRELSGEAKGPGSALLFALLSMTRPEGMAYAAFAGVAVLLDAIATRRVKPLLAWVPAFALPFVAYQAWRYWYFAWEFPNTYYAKQHQGTPFKPFGWTIKGWKYINGYALDYGIAYALPLFVFAMTGLRSWRRWVGVAIPLVVGFLVLWDGKAGLDSLPDWWRPVANHWVEARVWSIAGSAALLGLLTFGRPGWRARGLLWLNLCFGVFFALYSGGDWMDAYRWFNLTTLGMAVLLAVGIGELLDVLLADDARLRLDREGQPRFVRRGLPARPLAALVPTAALGTMAIIQTVDFANNPETAVRDIHRRVRYMTWVQHRLDLDHVRLLDVDMGAHMYYSGWAIVDIAGLVDVPMARHKGYDKKFVKNYVFDEFNPDFAHVHGGWARTSKLTTHREWKQRYIEVPGYPIGGRRLHVGNHIRKDLFVDEVTAPLPDAAVRFEGGVRLVRLEVPSPVVPTGGLVFLDTTWAARFRKDGFRVLAILDDGVGHRSVQALEPGYGWYPPEEWKLQERVDTRFRLPVPKSLPAGEYALSLLLLDEESGKVLAAEGEVGALRAVGIPDAFDPKDEAVDPVADGADGGAHDDAPDADAPGDDAPPAEDPLAAAPPIPAASGFGTGEWPTGVVIKVTTRATAQAEAGKDYATARMHADDGRCEESWAAFKDATRHLLRDEPWRAEREAELRPALAACYLARAAAAEPQADKVEALVQARFWDRHHRDYPAQAMPLADALVAEAEAFAAEESWGAAYLSYARALKLDPSRSWVRRSAETARDHMLGIAETEDEEDDPGEDPQEG